MIRILVVDDHAVVRAGVHYFIDDIPDMEIAGEAGTAEEAIRLIRAQDWDIVLLDIAMPDKSGVEVLKQIKREKPELPVLILSMHPENRYAVQILRSGASGYVQKEALATELVSAIQTIMRGHKYISYAVAELLTMDPDTNTEKPLHETVTRCVTRRPSTPLRPSAFVAASTANGPAARSKNFNRSPVVGPAGDSGVRAV